MTVWRGDKCPVRGPGLSHAMNYGGRCTFCNEQLHSRPPDGVPESASEATPGRAAYATVFDHMYVFTLTGRCARRGCAKTKDEHADFLIGGAGTDCVVAHESVKPWTECPICGFVVEPRMFTPQPATTASSTARLWINARQMRRLKAIREGWVGGYFKS